MLRIGVVGYGTGGRHFHAPFIQAAKGCTLAGVVARAEATVAAVRADYPGLPIFPSLDAMMASRAVDAVTITTPPETRRDLVFQAIAAGLHVVADKPFAPNAAGARDLDRPAQDLAAWGYEPASHWGSLHTAAGATRIPAEPGRYHAYYEAFAAAVRTSSPAPVTGEEGTRTLAVLDAARQSAEEGRSVFLGDTHG